MSTIEYRINYISASLNTLKQRLDENGYQFAEPDAALPGPTDDIAADFVIDELH
jgi:hypothetical protein